MWKSNFARLSYVICILAAASEVSLAHVKVWARFEQITYPEDGLLYVDNAEPNFFGTQFHSATARIGTIRAYTSFDFTKAQDFNHGSSAYGEFGDTLTIFSEGHEGETGYIRFTLSVETEVFLQPGDGDFLANVGNIYGRTGILLTGPGGTVDRFYKRELRGAPDGGLREIVEGDLSNGLNSFLVPFQFGVPFTYTFKGHVQLFAHNSPAIPPGTRIEATIDVDGSGVWLDTITDSSGNPVTSYTYRSQSNVDYTKPIPEPTCGMMAIVALAGWMSQSRFRRVSTLGTPG